MGVDLSDLLGRQQPRGHPVLLVARVWIDALGFDRQSETWELPAAGVEKLLPRLDRVVLRGEPATDDAIVRAEVDVTADLRQRRIDSEELVRVQALDLADRQQHRIRVHHRVIGAEDDEKAVAGNRGVGVRDGCHQAVWPRQRRDLGVQQIDEVCAYARPVAEVADGVGSHVEHFACAGEPGEAGTSLCVNSFGHGGSEGLVP